MLHKVKYYSKLKKKYIYILKVIKISDILFSVKCSVTE